MFPSFEDRAASASRMACVNRSSWRLSVARRACRRETLASDEYWAIPSEYERSARR